MDIIELSHKMEADLLESHSKDLFKTKPLANENFSPRVTRSQTSNGHKCLVEETQIQTQEKRNSRKVDEMEKICLSRKTKVLHKNLETIYENPVWKKGNTMLLGTNKVKRSIYLDREFRITSKQKSKFRKMKIKRLGKRVKPFKISDEEFKSRMLRIENYINENESNIDCETKNCDVEFQNVDIDEDCTDLQNQNIELNGSNKSNQNKDFP